MTRDPNKLPFGQKRCKSATCAQVIVGLRTKICPHCGFDQMADNKVKKPVKASKPATAGTVKRGPGRPPKVQTSVPVIPQRAAGHDPYTFSVDLPPYRTLDKLPPNVGGKFPTEIQRNTAHFNPVLGVLTKPDKNGETKVMYKDVDVLPAVKKAITYAASIEVPDEYNLELLVPVFADENDEPMNFPVR
jgi:hypothetical protein